MRPIDADAFKKAVDNFQMIWRVDPIALQWEMEHAGVMSFDEAVKHVVHCLIDAQPTIAPSHRLKRVRIYRGTKRRKGE